MQWSAWHRISELPDHPARDAKLGVYQIRATTEDRKPKTIQRACGPDEEGILYIGQGDLVARLGKLLRIFENAPKPHHQFIGVFYDYHLERICDRRLIEMRWAECDNPIREEGRLIEEYKMRTGDIPPGNRKLGQFLEDRLLVPDAMDA